jgi:hypothetical protein
MSYLKKTVESLRKSGVRVTAKKVQIFFSRRLLWRRRYNEMLAAPSISERFDLIYDQNLWNDAESASGPGSTLEYTKNLREELSNIIKKYSVDTILDAPCGDFNWMREVTKQNPEIKYTGAEIVERLIDRNSKLFSAPNVKFCQIDITRDTLPKARLMIVRDCLFHLSFSDVMAFKQNLLGSGIEFLLTTTHIVEGDFRNFDIETGNFRRIDIFSSPFDFPDTALERIDDFIPPHLPRQMCLFDVKSLKRYWQFLSKRPDLPADQSTRPSA